ncbi:unnamed protein product [Caenorhabditis sp. 36 PRJEB53466]|nr:unnamed protein product [Caenorhabditis sp. 36 PRJEB53466]
MKNVTLLLASLLMVTVLSENCVDNIATCPDIKVYCAQEDVQRQCPKSCGVCTTDTPFQCTDNWTIARTMPTNAIFKTSKNSVRRLVEHANRPLRPPYCPLYCGLCGPIANTTVPVVTTPVQPTTSLKLTTDAPTTTVKTTLKPTTTTLRATSRKPTPAPSCKDSSPNCPAWAKNGFCTNNFYTPEQKKHSRLNCSRGTGFVAVKVVCQESCSNDEAERKGKEEEDAESSARERKRNLLSLLCYTNTVEIWTDTFTVHEESDVMMMKRCNREEIPIDAILSFISLVFETNNDSKYL